MKAPLHPALSFTPAFLPGSIIAIACLLGIQPAEAQSSGARYLYRWSFEAGGLPDTEMGAGIRGGELSIAGGSTGQAPVFQLGSGGVSDASPGVLNASGNIYGAAEGAQINSFGHNFHTGSSLEQFTITMWVKATLHPDLQPQARLINIGPADSEQGGNSVLIALEAAESPGFAFVVNNSSYYRINLKEPVIKENEWVFLVFTYDGLTENAHYCPVMGERFQVGNNGAILAGGLDQAPRLLTGAAVHTGAPTYSLSPGKFNLDGLLIAIGSSNARYDRSFVGCIDDVRIYNTILPLSELDRVRLEATGR